MFESTISFYLAAGICTNQGATEGVRGKECHQRRNGRAEARRPHSLIRMLLLTERMSPLELSPKSLKKKLLGRLDVNIAPLHVPVCA